MLIEWSGRREEQAESWADDDPQIKSRIERLEPTARKQVRKAIRTLGRADGAERERIVELSGALVSAYEYRHFHDVIEQIDEASEDPDDLIRLLGYLREWKSLESRAILEIVRGRLEVVEKFHSMIANDAPETNPAGQTENMHDLIASYPWLLDPEWQVLAEEKTMTAQLREWAENENEGEPADRSRYDFFALEGPNQYVIIEIKRSGHPVTIEEVQRVLRYKHALSRGAGRSIRPVLVSGGTYDFDATDYAVEFLTWSDTYERAKGFYEHYRAILEGDIEHADWHRKSVELSQTREVLSRGAYRTREDRATGLGPQDVRQADDDE